MLAIEIDGQSHDVTDAGENDEKRQQILENLGVSFLRFSDIRVKKDISGIVFEIQQRVEQLIS